MLGRMTGRASRTERDTKMNIQNSVSLGQAPPPNLRTGDAAPRPAVQVPVQQKPEPTPQQVQQALQSINKVLQTSNSNLEFSIDAGTKRLVVKVMDTETGELIRQIPSEAVLAIAESIGELQKGLLLRQEA
jgi:flagellar protein FlaG